MKHYILIFTFFLCCIGRCFSQTVFEGRLKHTNDYFWIAPFSSQYDDGSQAKIYYDGNNKVINFLNDQSSHTNLNIGSLKMNYTEVNSTGYKSTILNYSGHSFIIGTIPGETPRLVSLDIRPGGQGSGETPSALNLYQTLGEGNYEKRVRFNSNGDSYINGGSLGIGTTAPQAKLHVNGNILASEVKVSTEASQVPDYVFKDDYQLTSLADLEQYIKSNSHLPEVPSAEEIEANGLELAKMNLLLLKKIEELTLHTIRQQKLLEEQAYKLAEQSNRIEALENR